MLHPARLRKLREGAIGLGPVVYWMSRDQRVYDNWALYGAIKLARQYERSLEIVFGFDPQFLGGTLRQVDYKCKSLAVVQEQARENGIRFSVVVDADITGALGAWFQGRDPAVIVTDFSPLRIHRTWNTKICEQVKCSVIEIDAHNIFPAWHISPKQEFQAATFRPKVNKNIAEFLDEFPPREAYKFGEPVSQSIPRVDFAHIIATADTDRSVLPVDWVTPGPIGAEAELERFISERIEGYATLRNDPNREAQSDLSPYLHYGNIAPQRVALRVRDSEALQESKDAFLEEHIVRREVAENYCLYCTDYDRFEGAWKWAQESLREHWNDAREYTYTLEQFENAATHDTLWNAAQNEMRSRGKMHGFMRMYWAKKILEWSNDPSEAIRIAIYLNDRYELDGRDPNGYTGIMWSICGIHDRPWFDRTVYGKVRYMNRNGCEKKFDVGAYVGKWGNLN
jgi:deoxyribodipyrimidine photo-lyase